MAQDIDLETLAIAPDVKLLLLHGNWPPESLKHLADQVREKLGRDDIWVVQLGLNDTIEALTDEDLQRLGLQRIERIKTTEAR